MSNAKHYYKAVTKNLCGRNGFQYEVGGVYTPGEEDMDDDWHWLHFADRLSTITMYGGESPRILEVRPLGQVSSWTVPKVSVVLPPRCKRGKYYCTDKLEVVRELSRDEILKILKDEGCPPWYALCFNPPYEMLEKWKNKRKCATIFRSHVLGRDDLTKEEKRKLLPAHLSERLI